MPRTTRSPLLSPIRTAVRASGLPLLRIQARTGIDNAALSRFVRGERGLSVPNLERLMALLGLRVVGPDERPAGWPPPGKRKSAARRPRRPDDPHGTR